jgi:immunoglobulin-like protein involved in spore germination/sporulation and spore germination protein
MRVALVLVALVAGLALVGCGDGDDEAVTTDTATTPVESTPLRVYFVRDGQVWPVAREVGDALSDEIALDQLLDGPNADESEIGLETALPEGLESADVTVEDGVATVELEGAGDLTREALAQIVYTETALPLVESVAIDGESFTRADFEEQTPSVLVESPLPFAEVTSPLRATGTANTFEANFQYELLGADGEVVDENFVTATSGTGTRGTFDFTTGEFDDITALVVFESSAEDGSRMHEVEIPLTTAP